MLIVRSPVRISFAGGGTDLPAYYEQFGGAVLSVAINKSSYTMLEKRSDDRIQIMSSGLRICGTWLEVATMTLGENGLQIPLAVLRGLDRHVNVDLFLASEIPPGTGLGTSASVCVNVLHALTTYLRSPLSKRELADRSFHVQRDILGWHAGKQDEYAAVFGGLNFMTFQPDGTTQVEPLHLAPEVLRGLQNNLLLYFTGSADHSWTILERQEQSTRSHTGAAVDALHEVRRVADCMREALRGGELSAFGSLLNLAWQAKKRASNGISTPRIDRLYQLARDRGALGGKITGAGGGGFLLLYCEPDRQEAVRTAMAAEGIPEMPFAFDFQGTRVIVNEPFMDS